jgi:hypothetical protein
MNQNNINNEKKTNSDFSEILKGLDNKWVIISENNDRVIASSDDLTAIAERLSEGVLLKVPDSHSYLAPSNIIR